MLIAMSTMQDCIGRFNKSSLPKLHNVMKTKAIVFYFAALLLNIDTLNARLAEAWSYHDMFDKAELVVIARVVKTTETDERSKLLDIDVVGVTTYFKTHLVLKGDKGLKEFRLHHYKLGPAVKSEEIANGPQLVRFSWEHPPFLLFLIRESDGRYAPVTGQVDPGGLSVLELHGGAD